jgi:hypothetical protein
MSNLMLSDVKAAIERAANRDQDWQAAMCEIAMLPAVEQAWRAKNNGQALAVRRIDGIPHKGFEIPDNRARGDARRWAEVGGYILYLSAGAGYTYNDVRPDWYSHSASVTWDGCGRSTYCRVIETAKSAYHQATRTSGSFAFAQDDSVAFLRQAYGITIVDDLGGSDV